MKFLKKIPITLLTAFITMMLVYGGYTIYAEKKYDFENAIDARVMTAYHDEMNKLFNGKLSSAVKILKNPEGVNSPLLKSPCTASEFKEKGGIDKCEKKCMDNPENASTYCVSVQAMDRYMRYIALLNSIQGSVNFESLGWTELRITPITETLYKEVLNRNTAIDTDIETSRRVMEATLAAYDEFLTAYPIHMRYKTIIGNLIKYKNKLRDIRTEVIKFPSTFIDTTSTKCS